MGDDIERRAREAGELLAMMKGIAAAFALRTPIAQPRKQPRMALDDYPTPAWCVRRLVEAVPSLQFCRAILEPSAGSGAIIRACTNAGVATEWTAVELDPRHASALVAFDDVDAFCPSDFLQWEADRSSALADAPFDLALGNPPFSHAIEFVQACMRVSRQTCMLLRVGFLESEDRNAWVRQHVPDIYVLPNRPAFQHGKTDSCVYAWHWWPTSEVRTRGELRVLPSTSIAERKMG